MIAEKSVGLNLIIENPQRATNIQLLAPPVELQRSFSNLELLVVVPSCKLFTWKLDFSKAFMQLLYVKLPRNTPMHCIHMN